MDCVMSVKPFELDTLECLKHCRHAFSDLILNDYVEDRVHLFIWKFDLVFPVPRQH